MFGNLIRECGVLNRLSETAQNELANLITLLLGITISASMKAEQFVRFETLMIMGLGLLGIGWSSKRRTITPEGGSIWRKSLGLCRSESIPPGRSSPSRTPLLW